MKASKVSFSAGIAAIAIAFFALVLINNLLFDKLRLDLTEGDLYSISEGTHRVIEQIDEPINLYFFFSNKATEGLTPLRNYANRIQSLLEEYERYADGKINLQIIDPEPFSEAEDKAAEMGLTAAPLSALGDSVYLGLAATNTLDDEEVIAFFDPSQEVLLEYEISKLIYRLSNPESLKVSVISSLPVQGGMNPNPMAMQMGQPQTVPAWASFDQLEQLYEVELLEADAQEIPEDTSVLLVVHPKSLSQGQLYAIDQYVLAGGKAMILVDPLAESDAQVPGMMGVPEPSRSDLPTLFKAWGIQYSATDIVLDAAKGLEIRMPSGMPGRHVGYIGLEGDSISEQDIVTNALSLINGASMGHLNPSEGATTQFQTLLQSSDFVDVTSAETYMMATANPESLLDYFTPQEQTLTLAARVSGPAKSSFTQVPEGQSKEQHIASSEDIQLLVVADTDILTDAFWVQVTNFFGQPILQPVANNGDFLINAVDNLGGSTELMSIRGKNQYQRPFDVVEELTVEAEAKFREQEQLLQAQLQQTVDQLAQLQGQQGEAGSLVLNAEQEAAIDEFVAKKLEIRKQLREVRHQLDKDIESLGAWLKVLNIAVMPLLLTLLLAFIAKKLSRRRQHVAE